MAREKRKRSETGIYHVMLRGIEGRNIFKDDEDKGKFKEAIIKAKEKGEFFLFGYCLMNNHVHMLIKENEEIGISIKRITVSYVQWYNNKYGREGHLFQNRYRSEVVENERYLLVVLRYIHQNPLKAKIENKIGEYTWSSYKDYLDYYDKKEISEIVDTEMIYGYYKNKINFEKYTKEINKDECLEYIEKVKYTDDELQVVLKERYGIDKISKMSIKERNQLIRIIKNDIDISNRQLARVLNIGRGIVEKAIRV